MLLQLFVSDKLAHIAIILLSSADMHVCDVVGVVVV